MTCWVSCCSHNVRIATCLCIVVVAFILDVIGFSVPHWYYDGSTQMFEGLWKSCSEVNDVVTCVDWIDAGAPAWFKANQAMQTIGIIILLVALVCLCVLLICRKGDYSVKVCAICFLIFAAWFKANQAMQTIGIIILLVALVCLCVLLICRKGDYSVKVCAICFLIFAAWLKANQALQTIGMVFLLVALVCICVLLICKKGDYKVKICAICFLIASAVFILIGVILYGACSSAVVTSNLSFGFAFVIVAAILAIIAAICLCIGIDNNWGIEDM